MLNLGFFLILFDWGFNSDLNFVINWSYTGSRNLGIREWSINWDLFLIGYKGTTNQIWDFFNIIWFGFQYLCLKLRNGSELRQVTKTCLIIFFYLFSLFLLYLVYLGVKYVFINFLLGFWVFVSSIFHTNSLC